MGVSCPYSLSRSRSFATPFVIRGRPGWTPSRLALVIVLQRAQKLTGQQEREPDCDGLPPGMPGSPPYDLDTRWGVKRDTLQPPALRKAISFQAEYARRAGR
jgi:hypothetical protein